MGGIQLINRLLIYPINIYLSLVEAAPYRKLGRWRRTMKRACPLSWERSGWAGISNLSGFVSLQDLNAVTSGFGEIFTSLSQEVGSLRVRRLRGHVLGKDLLQLGHCKPQGDEEGSLGSLPAGPHHSQRPTFQHCDIHSYYFTVWTTVVDRWWDRKHLL